MRQKWENYFMSIASEVAKRSTCDRAFVGAVIVDEEKRVVATGYNGSAGSGTDHCLDIGHTMRDSHCIATVHAEQNAIADCARTGKAVRGASIYVTHFPCLNCTKLIIAAGIRKIAFMHDYRVDDFAYAILKANNVEMLKVDTEDSVEVFQFTPDKISYEIV